jgi:hypothetical protein
MAVGQIYNTNSEYATGKIYKITSPSTSKIYIGSTRKSLNQRFSNHISNYSSNRGVKSGEIIKYNNANIELIEEYSCNSKRELEKREAYHIKQNIDNCVNKCIPCRSKREYWLDNKEDIDEIRRFKIDCPCGGAYIVKHRTTHFKTGRHIKYLDECQ